MLCWLATLRKGEQVYVVNADLGVDAALIGEEVLVVKPGIGYVRTYAAIRALLPDAPPTTITSLTDQACPIRTVTV